jgi:succinate dehydrogenase / fumarate reductase membrane anchor subunit
MSTPRTPQYRTAARRVRGLGAAHSGTSDFIILRVTSVALLLLSVVFVVIVVALLGRNHATVVRILGSPVVAVAMLLFVGATVYHMWIGMQEIIIDYVHEDGRKFLTLIANSFFCLVVGVACIYAILKLSFGV